MRIDTIDYNNIFNAVAGNNIKSFKDSITPLLGIVWDSSDNAQDKNEAENIILRALDGFSKLKEKLKAAIFVYEITQDNALNQVENLKVQVEKKINDLIDTQATPKEKLQAAIFAFKKSPFGSVIQYKALKKVCKLILEQGTPKEKLKAAKFVCGKARRGDALHIQALLKADDLIYAQETPKEKLKAAIFVAENTTDRDTRLRSVQKAYNLIDMQATPKEKLKAAIFVCRNAGPGGHREVEAAAQKAYGLIDAQETPQERLKAAKFVYEITKDNTLKPKALTRMNEIKAEIANIKPMGKDAFFLKLNTLNPAL